MVNDFHKHFYFITCFPHLLINNKNKKLLALVVAAVTPFLVTLLLLSTTTTTTIFAAESGKQIIINPTNNNFKSIDSFGKWNNTDYTSFYNVKNLYDNLTNTWSFWSQLGNAGWAVNLNQPLQPLVCSIEIDVYKPKNAPFTFELGNDERVASLDGILDNSKETIFVEGCMKDVNRMGFNTNPGPGNWSSLSEVKLFSNTTTVPPVEPPVCGPGTHLENGICVPDKIPPVEPPVYPNATKFTINNSTVFMNVTDSRIILNISDDTQVIQNNAQVPEEGMTDDDDEEEDEEEEDEEEHEEESEEQKEEDDEN